MARMEEDLVRNRGFLDMPNMSMVFDPERKLRMFDAMFTGGEEMYPKFQENKEKNTLECQLNTGCGDFFRPEDIEVNINGRNVEFKAKREEKSEDGNNYSVREVRRFFTVPETADAERLEAQMAPNGKLMITAPLVTPAIEQKKEGPFRSKLTGSNLQDEASPEKVRRKFLNCLYAKKPWWWPSLNFFLYEMV